MTVWSFFCIHSSMYLPWIAWPLEWWLMLYYLNPITTLAPLRMHPNWSGQQVYLTIGAAGCTLIIGAAKCTPKVRAAGCTLMVGAAGHGLVRAGGVLRLCPCGS
jgi:hypothetical protein